MLDRGFAALLAERLCLFRLVRTWRLCRGGEASKELLGADEKPEAFRKGSGEAAKINPRTQDNSNETPALLVLARMWEA
jgi:hypothetical protein